MPYYADVLRKLYKERGWRRKGAVDYVPHDAKVTEWGSDRSRIEQMFAKGLNPHVPTQLHLADGINAVRAILPLCEFDAEGCAEGLSMLKAYRKEWDEVRGCWKDAPRHDLASDGADGFRTMACAYRDLAPPAPPPKQEMFRKGAGGEELLTVEEWIARLGPLNGVGVRV
jgi:hypothetical protein